jgi:hypothetical protein
MAEPTSGGVFRLHACSSEWKRAKVLLLHACSQSKFSCKLLAWKRIRMFLSHKNLHGVCIFVVCGGCLVPEVQKRGTRLPFVLPRASRINTKSFQRIFIHLIPTHSHHSFSGSSAFGEAARQSWPPKFACSSRANPIRHPRTTGQHKRAPWPS